MGKYQNLKLVGRDWAYVEPTNALGFGRSVMRASIALSIAAILTACSPSDESGDQSAAQEGTSVTTVTDADYNLECAAMISAADRQGSNVKSSGNWTATSNDILVGSMTHLNTYAIPAGLREAEAFKQLDTLRTKVMREVSGAEIIERAKVCLEEVTN